VLYCGYMEMRLSLSPREADLDQLQFNPG
jgi:hypothetical protein